MIALFDRLSRPFLRALDPEDAHNLVLKALRLVPGGQPQPDPPELRVRAFGLNFPNPIGLAAGFDKNAVAPDALLRLGFGFVEVGTLTPRAQIGNPRPRVFRLEADGGVINRLGFNNGGAPAALARLAARAHASGVVAGGVVGVNIGANKDSADRSEDYVRLIETFAAVASYFTVNVSSPNTPGLRSLQQADALDDLLARVTDAREKVRPRAGPTPILVKIAPDLTLAELDDVVGVARKHRVDGMIVSNTTISRPAALRDQDKARESGGLSGKPIFRLSTRMLAETFVRTENAFPLIGVGGIDSGATAIAKIKAGASLVQLYTGLIYQGIGLVAQMKADIAAAIKRGNRESLAAMVGVDAADITADSWPT
ncbi:dihydroorotate dehydrogenase (quinone) [Pseudolabrys sp. Root1462]|uniref:quinone-dependent dihydroorotate dehydrogenase n=1 Tax=Pseudolabrys sp. Root1462 TaxID=1736466 RepID=UPI00070281FC|nr:quinone-dependent dihydroorotate dehydrogenase [Pseudolabrys sp. Root1462]KQY98462.1 dihydroorotate dehydrogenase (quinone) [Pseudolabrys sp. Root1462]